MLEAIERLVGVQAETILPVGVRFGEHSDVCAGAEELLTRAGDHDHLDRFVEASLYDALVNLPHHLVRICICGRIVERENRDPVLHLVLDQYLLGHLRYLKSLDHV